MSLKKRFLDKEKLSKESLEEITKLFAVGDSKTGRICCDDYHPHSYRCNEYYRADIGIVDRLITEIEKYRNKLKELAETCSEK